MTQHIHDPSVFIKSSFSSNNGSCVEAAMCSCGEVQVQDSKNPGPTLTFTSAEWSAFIQGAKAGEFG